MYHSTSLPSSSSTSSNSGIGSLIASAIEYAFFPFSGSSGMTRVSPTAMNSVLSLQQRSATGSLSRAAFGWTTTVAISLLLVQWIGNKDKKKTTPLDWITRMLSMLWSDQQHRAIDQPSSSTATRNGVAKGSAEEAETMTVLLNRGSCHCGSITFKLTPAREVRVIQSPLSGKLQYPTARVPSDQLHLVSGKHLWNTYHVQSEETGETWAYSFCKHCAIHLLHATDADQTSLFVNLQCFNIEGDKLQKNKDSFFVPRVLKTQNTDGDDSVVTKMSVISTVTAATQKSLLTTVTSLPEYANPRTFGQLQQQHVQHQTSTGDDSGDTDSAAPVERRGRSRTRATTPRLSPMVERRWGEEEDLPRGVVAYSASSLSRPQITPLSAASPAHSRFGQPVAPVAAWPIQDDDEEDEDDEQEAHDDDDKDSISSHSGDIDYFSSSTMDGGTATRSTSTTATSSIASSIDYNVTANRERMLQNMRKHLKSSKPITPTAPTRDHTTNYM
ncbi:hypothetical protein ACA910_016619 [Epithemia clementina (nom. ined.)]